MATQTKLERQSFEDIKEYLETRANISHNKELIDKLIMQSNNSIYSMETMELMKQLREQIHKDNTKDDLSPQYINMLDEECAEDHIEYIKQRIVEQFDFSEKPLHENQNEIAENLGEYLHDIICRLSDDLRWVKGILPHTHNPGMVNTFYSALSTARDYRIKLGKEIDALQQAQENIMHIKSEIINN